MFNKTKNENLNRLSVEDFKSVKKKPIIIVLDNIRSLNNIGSVFRTADSFIVEKIYLCGITAQPPHRDIQKTALGATETVEWEHNTDTLNTVKQLKTKGYKIVAVEQTTNSTFLHQYNKQTPIALVFGNEVNGVSQHVIDYCDEVIEIPQFGSKHSLNISVSAGIVLWEIQKLFS